MVNVIICGTPGTGKSTIIERLKNDGLFDKARHINVSRYAIENDCTSGYDEEFESYDIDEDKLEKSLRPLLEDTNTVNIIESIHADIVPPELVDLVFVCRTNNTLLYDRLKSRNYSEKKVSENLQAEIFQTIMDEAMETYDKPIVHELVNDTLTDLERNSKEIVEKTSHIVELKRRCN